MSDVVGRRVDDTFVRVAAPTGLVFEPAFDALIVASTLDNAVFAVPQAAQATNNQGTGTIVYQDPVHLHGALAMAKAPNGHLLVTQNDAINADPNQPSEIVEFTLGGQFVKQVSIDPNRAAPSDFKWRIWATIRRSLPQ